MRICVVQALKSLHRNLFLGNCPRVRVVRVVIEDFWPGNCVVVRKRRIIRANIALKAKRNKSRWEMLEFWICLIWEYVTYLRRFTGRRADSTGKAIKQRVDIVIELGQLYAKLPIIYGDINDVCIKLRPWQLQFLLVFAIFISILYIFLMKYWSEKRWIRFDEYDSTDLFVSLGQHYEKIDVQRKSTE